MNRPCFLVSRTDRAGDVILTLPVFRQLRQAYPEARIIAHVRSYTAPLLALCHEADRVIVDEHFAPGLFSADLAAEFRRENIDHAIIVHPSARTITACWRAGIKHRVGRASNIWQFFLNDRRVQKRSKNEKHEFCYNLDLLQGIVAAPDYLPYRFAINQSQKTQGMKILASIQMADIPPVIIHPGHGGSAYNISPQQYAGLAARLVEKNIPVLVSLGPEEEHLKTAFPPARTGKLDFLCQIPDLQALAEIFSCCKAFIGGSTGPLHLAAALGLPCIAFFPPVRAMTPERWGPVGCKSLVIRPELDYCKGKCDSCAYSGCMNRLTTDMAMSWLQKEIQA
jgi:ADP-heptose:LPS heptosyltransferase